MAAVAMEVDDAPPLERKEARYTRKDEDFERRVQRYKGQQYSHLYYCRLHKLRGALSSLVQSGFPGVPVCPILGLEDGKRCVVIGTIYKQMKLKPSILDEYAKERSKLPLATASNFMHPDDYLVLEDESGRVKLVGSVVVPSNYVTGIVIAACGAAGKDGDFFVQEIIEPGLPPQPPLPSITEDKYVAFISGLRIGSDHCDPLQLQLLVDHLTGHLGDEQEQMLSAQVIRLIVAGNSLDMQYNLLAGQAISAKDQARLTEPVKELDLVLTQIAAAMPVDIMPGANDPANFTLPQQSLHKCLFPGASAYCTFLPATNPHRFELDGIEFLGTSGQNVDDLDKYSEAKDVLELMERTLRWRHIAPTAPDTLGCYPYTDKDPFVLDRCPHVYFCGNQRSCMSRLLTVEGKSVRAISIPRFCDSGTAVLVNLRTLDYHLLTLSTSALLDA
ncbi:DNA polymerase delta small subunit [Selaginella moellendorffii]|uniref:DNA polymerase delta small subunit n=1 Tax=Selaginella moellendorffii TaxID=88036 RepID=UPI000D1CE412|nr:DNA polymerase delta small subunit [Selaginella moellendorffii]|eukprot:XP_024521106.1 DNA polymerase delta small subunit [Selaginella moellendorffii]